MLQTAFYTNTLHPAVAFSSTCILSGNVDAISCGKEMLKTDNLYGTFQLAGSG